MMINIVPFLVKYLFPSVVMGITNVSVVRDISSAFNLRLEIIKKSILICVSFIFYLSLFLFYKHVFFSDFIMRILGEAVISPFLGLLWTVLFYAGAKSLDKDITHWKKVRVWVFFSTTALAFFWFRLL